jgi:L-alanine-DL-glutamate epimerase-like enolase superfamily enzyme
VRFLMPILKELVIPHFLGKDARDLELLIRQVYLFKNNYKIAGLALWCPVAWVEMSILDLLGKTANQNIADLFGGVLRTEIPVYAASGNRDTTPQQEADILVKWVEQTGVKAVKFKVGGRMSKDQDSIPGRSEALIPLARKALGDCITIHADSNGSYGVEKAIDIGKRLEDIQAEFFEEPCEFDHLEETRRVAEALTISIAGGECENSMRRFRWMIQNSAVQVIQPDLHYNGGFIRARQIAAMAEQAGLRITPHMGASGAGFVEVVQFVSFTPNTGPYQEYKGKVETVGKWYEPTLQLKNGAISIPTGPGLGLREDLPLFQKARKII